MKNTILEAKELCVDYNLGTRFSKKIILRALRNVSISVSRNCRYGIVGESGSGKSTLAKTIVGTVKPTQGEIYFNDEKIRASNTSSNIMAKKIQAVFQDPYGSLDPRQKILDCMIEPLKANKLYVKGSSEDDVKNLFERIGLRQEMLSRYPHELSGGQRQRVNIARAVLLKPELLIFDEPTSSLDLSTQAQVAKLIREELSSFFNFTYIFISHNLELVWYMCDIICVMYKGQVIEVNDRQRIFHEPANSYTQELVNSVAHQTAS